METSQSVSLNVVKWQPMFMLRDGNPVAGLRVPPTVGLWLRGDSLAHRAEAKLGQQPLELLFRRRQINPMP
jgi:hypothetical protein